MAFFSWLGEEGDLFVIIVAGSTATYILLLKKSFTSICIEIHHASCVGEPQNDPQKVQANLIQKRLDIEACHNIVCKLSKLKIASLVFVSYFYSIASELRCALRFETFSWLLA